LHEQDHFQEREIMSMLETTNASEPSVSSEPGARSAGGVPAPSRTAITAAVIGNTLEWFDFAVYGYFALTIAKLFFPARDETTSLLITVATFGVGFVMPPIGAIILGQLGDTHGRKAALSLTILLMALGTAMIGLAPTYASAGLWGPAIIVLARLIQGFSAGGEIGGATAFLVEHAPLDRRGYFASLQQASQAGALLLGSLFGAAMTSMLSTPELEAWGWRLPFLFGLLIGPAGWYIRSRTEESGEFRRTAEKRPSSPLRTVFVVHGRSVVAGFGVTVIWTVCTYFFLVYMPTYAVRTLGISQSTSFLANSVGLLTLLIAAPVFGNLSDKIGRPPLMIGFAAAILFASYPALALLAAHPDGTSLLLVQLLFAILIAGFTGPAPAAMAELYPAEVRSTGLSVAYNFAVTIFGGFAPFIATWLIARTGDPLSPAWYVTLAAAISLGSLIFAAKARAR
jgi:MFS transporter, MHS family, proline/betaine transporter